MPTKRSVSSGALPACLQGEGGVELGHKARQLAQQLVPAGAAGAQPAGRVQGPTQRACQPG